MHAPKKPSDSQDAERQDPNTQPDPKHRRGPPQRLEDTDASGDALNDTGEDNHRHKHED
ncbi:hypothetical protein ISP15_10630 [Dyella jejuensis]|uniref:Uncharacterized protein n=1 Tax=Dyella jejuensis TaxID=1432009 RepID=A0ABW8JJX6_9GAMM